MRSTGSSHVGFSSCGVGFSSCGARALLLCGMWELPGPGLEPVSPALAGGFLTTAPPGKPKSDFFFFNLLFIYLFMAVLGLRFCARAFSSCGKWGPLTLHRGAWASHYRGFSCCGAQAPDAQAQ